MRVLICDQESEMLEAVSRAFDVDTATSKATCVDLMRANPFDVLVASERLSDGSGLELLSHVASRWPDTLRILAIEPQRLKLLGRKLAPFRLHSTIRYPIDEDELEAALKRMYELLGSEKEKPAEPQQPAGRAAPRARMPAVAAAPMTTAARGKSTPPPTPQSNKPSIPQRPARPSSPATRMPATAGAKSAPPVSRGGAPLGAPRPSTPPPVRRKLGNYTPLGAPEDSQLRIVEREFDQTVAPLAARAIRTREEATRIRTPREKLAMLANQIGDTLRRLLKR